MGPELIKNIVNELEEFLTAGIVNKVFQPDERDVYLRVFRRGTQELLLISTNPKAPRMHLTKTRAESPPTPKRFCAYLRSRLMNAVIESIRQVEGERVVNIRLKKGPNTFLLAIELIGKSSNIILLDAAGTAAGTVLDALRHFPAGSQRRVEPGIILEPLPLASVKDEGLIPREDAQTWNEAADIYYSGQVEAGGLDKERSALRRAIRQAEKRLTRKHRNLSSDRERGEGFIAQAKFGELLTANFGKLERGMKEFTADDYYTDPPVKVTIPLDERIGPKENIEKYFKRARKAKTTLKLLETRIPLLERELEYIRSLYYALESVESKEDSDTLREELIEAGYLKEKPLDNKRGANKRGPVVHAEPVRRHTSSEGLLILSGKSGPGNDLLVKKYAKRGDIWFHAKGMPGSHVLLKAGGGKGPSAEAGVSIEEAAGVAAWYSKARASTKVEVLYTDSANVRKPRGGKPGMVTVKEYKTLIVKPGVPKDT